jgi:hypothetical protein
MVFRGIRPPKLTAQHRPYRETLARHATEAQPEARVAQRMLPKHKVTFAPLTMR